MPKLFSENNRIYAFGAGVLTFAWDTLRDEETIFTMQFELLASGQPEISIGFADEPTLREVTVEVLPAIFVARDGTVRK